MKLERTIRQFHIQELQRLAIFQMLVEAGVEDPERYLAENEIETMATFKSNVLAIAIVGTTPKEQAAPDAR